MKDIRAGDNSITCSPSLFERVGTARMIGCTIPLLLIIMEIFA